MSVRSNLPLILLLCGLFVGCNASHPGVWNQKEIEAFMLKTENPKMQEVQLTANPDGTYTGTGKAADGESFKLTIRQNAEAKQLSWEAKGDRGTEILDGRYEFVK